MLISVSRRSLLKTNRKTAVECTKDLVITDYPCIKDFTIKVTVKDFPVWIKLSEYNRNKLMKYFYKEYKKSKGVK